MKVQRINPVRQRTIIRHVGGFYEAELQVGARIFRRWGRSDGEKILGVQVDELIGGKWKTVGGRTPRDFPTAAAALAYIKGLVG